MRIALIAPFIPHNIAPIIGGNQMLVTDLGRGLMQRGHKVTLFARDEAYAPGVPTEVISIPDFRPLATGQENGHVFFTQLNILLDLFLQLQERKHEFDVIHVHTTTWAAVAYSVIAFNTPVIHTLHISAENVDTNNVLRVLHRHNHPVTLVTVSHACAQTYAEFTSIDHVIYNGLDVDAIPFNGQVSPEAPLLFAGRIIPAKGVAAAIDIAQRAGHRLLIAGHIENREYYETRLAPKIEASDNQIRYIGLLKREELWSVMSQALGLLFPIQWDEPFGLTPVEAMATGTPVIAFRRGAVTEIMRHNETGFIIEPNAIDQAASQVDALSILSRARCRNHVETHFPLKRMLDAYELVYEKTILSYKMRNKDA
jgi:UDP-glucose:tetrahydrobiopterin glucosyltransferase